jgi:hypothetical protein
MAPRRTLCSVAVLLGLLTSAGASGCEGGPIEPPAAQPGPSTGATDPGDGGVEGPLEPPGGGNRPTETLMPTGGAGGPGEPLPTLVPSAPPRTLSAVEAQACADIPAADAAALAAVEALAARSATSQSPAAREQVATLFDEAIAAVEPYLQSLPDGPVRSAAVVYRSGQAQVRNALLGGGPVTAQPVLDAEAMLEAACATG